MTPPLTTTLDDALRGFLDWWDVYRDEIDPDLGPSLGYHMDRAREALAAQPAPPTEALRLLRAVRDADVVFAKGDWPISRAIAEYLDAYDAGRYLAATTVREGGDWTREEGMGPVPMGEAYALDHEASALPAVASPAPLDVERLREAIDNLALWDNLAEEYERLDPTFQATLPTADDVRGILSRPALEGQPVAEEPRG